MPVGVSMPSISATFSRVVAYGADDLVVRDRSQIAAVDRHVPGPIRRFPFNLYLWETRLRRLGRPVD